MTLAAAKARIILKHRWCRNPPSQRLPLLQPSPHWAAALTRAVSMQPKVAWNAGIPVSDLLTGRVSVQAPAPQPTAQPAAAAPKVYSVTDERRPGGPNRLRVSSSMGNSASAPISSPPSVAKAMANAPAAPATTAPAGAAREADEDASSEATAPLPPRPKRSSPPYTYPSLNLFNAAKPEDERGAAAEMKKKTPISW